MEFLQLLLSALLSVVALFVIAKIMGHKQVAELDFFDYISGITIGSIAAEMATELEAPWKPLVALAIYGIASIILNIITAKLPRSRKFINGTPTILIKNGRIYRKNLAKSKLDISELLLLLRQTGYFDIDEVELAVFEHNGKLSVLPRAENRPLAPSDLGITPPAAEMGVEVIMDGRVLGENLKRLGRDERWLGKRLSDEGYSDAAHILLAVWRKGSDKLSVYPVDGEEK